MWIIVAFVALAIAFWAFGWSWQRGLKRPALTSNPLVSIFVPVYKTDGIKETLKSLSRLNWKKKEIIVVNDSEENLAGLCKQYGAKHIMNSKRLGKAKALNNAVKHAKGQIYFFIDSDTVAEPDCFEKIVPWFSDKKIAAVAPRYVAKNRNTLVAKLVGLENCFISSLFKTHMFFGSMISFRGCGVAIRASSFKKLGRWPYTLIEDAALSAKIVSSGLKIQYEPEAMIRTTEPATFSELRSQRFRWGKGAAFSFLQHIKLYKTSPQFILHFFPYILISLAIAGFFFFQTAQYIIPALSFYILYTFSIKEFLTFALFLFLPLVTNIFASVTTASASHIALLAYPETEKPEKKDLLLVVPYIFVYLPAIMWFYIKGIVSGIRDKRKGKPELDLSNW